LLKAIVQVAKKSSNLYLINVRGPEQQEYSCLHSKWEAIPFSKSKTIKSGSIVIVEDILNLEKHEELALRTMLNFDAHHKTLKIFCVAHTITKNQIYGVMSLFNFIIFTNSPSNGPVLRATFRYFKIEKEFSEQWIKKFKSHPHKTITTYFFFDCVKMEFWVAENIFKSSTFHLLGTLQEVENSDKSYQTKTGDFSWIDSKQNVKAKNLSSSVPKSTSNTVPNMNLISQNESTTKVAILEAKFKNLVEELNNHKQAESLFSIIVNCINLDFVSIDDLSFSFVPDRNSKHASIIKISLVDYILTLLDVQKKPSERLIVLHKYVSSLCSVPSFLIKNRFL